MMTESSGVLIFLFSGLLLVCLALLFLLAKRLRRAAIIQTQLKKSIADLTARSDQLSAGIDGLGAALFFWDMQTQELTMSDLFLEMTGHQRAKLAIGLGNISRFIHPEDLPDARQILAECLEKRTGRCECELRIMFGDQEFHWVQARALVTRDNGGRPVRLVGSLTDISEKVLAEEERDRLFNLSVDMLSVGGFDGSFHQLNPAWVRVLGWSRDDILAKPLLHFIHQDDVQFMVDNLQILKEGEATRGVESRFLCRDGTYRWLSWSSFPYPEHELIFSVIRDVTEQKEAETKVLDFQERLRSLSNQMSLVEDRQRQELATAIHDGLAQQLFGIRAKVTLLKYPDKLADYQTEIQEILEVLDDTMREARNLSFELFPPVLHEVGLEAALIWLARQFRLRTTLTCDVLSDDPEEELPEDLRAMAYQSVRELLNNVYKHAEATAVTISLKQIPGYLTLRIEDNGTGFENNGDRVPTINQETGFGLFSIRERFRSVGGRMLVNTRPGQGCRVILSIPLTH